MRLKIIKVTTFFMLLSLCNCGYVDISGLFVSSYVDQRFIEKDNLDNFYAPDLSNDNNYNFLVIADTHYYNLQPNFFKIIEQNKNKWNISFVVLVGDIVQNGLESAYKIAQEDFSQSSIPIYPIIGNHDLYNEGYEAYKNVFGSRTIYNFKIGSSHFIFLDTANGTLGRLQKEWLENILDDTNASNIFIFSHYSPTDRVWQSYCEWSFPEEKYFLFDLCDKHNVDYFICGHLHFNDEKVIRDVKYIIVNAVCEDDEKYFLVISVTGDDISHHLY